MGDKSGYDGAKIALEAIPDDKCKGGYSSSVFRSCLGPTTEHESLGFRLMQDRAAEKRS
jgi:hypothetical protein